MSANDKTYIIFRQSCISVAENEADGSQNATER